ncbi:MAG TPA: glycogen synthase GlgA [Erysipelothrix sp.]|nr:glycogen synthase GlgA [Erysipelothrix sp.]
MKVLFVAGESVPFIKTGGLADVVGSLPSELKKEGVDVRVALPLYKDIPQKFKDQMVDITNFDVYMGWKTVYAGVKTLKHQGIQYYFIDNLEFFNRDGCYGYWDDGERFAFFSMAVIEMMERIDFIPNIIHVHDWHTAMIPMLLVHKYHWIEAYQNIRKVLTIHNLRFQGIYNPVVLESLFGLDFTSFKDDGVKYYNSVNYLQGGINYADIVTTVSPSYADEIQTPEFGETLDGILRYNAWKVYGILNGIDTKIYDPKNDPFIEPNYGVNGYNKKMEVKEALQKELGLPVDKDIPMIASVSRLSDQKGFNLVNEILEEVLQTNAQYVVLGTGEESYEHSFKYFQQEYPDNMRALIEFDAEKAQKLYAASDLFLMPSAFEPCGLSQMISLRYGSVPIVHEVGGLKDSIKPFNEFENTGTGFTFYDFRSSVLKDKIFEALDLFYNQRDKFKMLARRGMREDFSWSASVKEYMKLYEELLEE